MMDRDAFAGIERVPLAELFAAEPDRAARLVVEEAGIRFDLSRTHLSRAALDGFAALAESRGLGAARDALFAAAGAAPAERGQGAPGAVAQARGLHARMRGLIDAIEAEALGPVAHVLHLTEGGMAAAPRLLLDALGRDEERYDVATVTGFDGEPLDAAFARFDPAATLIAIGSIEFADPATLLNAEAALAWLTERNVPDPYGRVIALTAAPEAAIAWGVDETRVLPFAAVLGARRAVWGAAGFPVALALGWQAFEELLEGAAAMDRHFRLAPFAVNAPVLAACADLQAQATGSTTRANFAFDDRLRLLPACVQSLAGDGAAIVWGGGGEAWQAVAPALHREAPALPVEFVYAVEPVHALDAAHHRALLVDAIAQGAALAAAERPSTTILLDRVDPARLGALLAFHEHRGFVAARLGDAEPAGRGSDPAAAFARAIEDGDASALDPVTRALVARALG